MKGQIAQSQARLAYELPTHVLATIGKRGKCGSGVILLNLERAVGIETASEVWEASILPLNYIIHLYFRVVGDSK